MMKSKFLSFILALLLVSVVFSMAFTSLATAEENDFEPDNDDAIYLFPRTDPEEPADGFNYNYNYTDVDEKEKVPQYLHWDHEPMFLYDSEMSLTAHVVGVTSLQDYNRIHIGITAAGAYRYNEESERDPTEDSYPPAGGHIGTVGQVIEAEFTKMVGYEDKTEEDPTIGIEEEHDSGINMTDGEEGDDGPEREQEIAAKGAILLADIADYKTLGALSAIDFAESLAGAGSDDSPDPFPDDVTGSSGSDASVRQTWKHPFSHGTPIEPEDPPLEGSHSASTMITAKLPGGDLPDEATLEISAKNIIGTTDGFSGDPDPEIPDDWETADGAEATVEIPIKNAEIQSVKNNPTSDTYNTYSGSKSVSITTGVTIPHNIPAPKVDYLNVTWDDGSDEDPIKQDWEPYTYEKPSGQDWYCFEDKETVASHTYSLDVNPGGSKDYNITVTAKMQDKYGGWEVSNTKNITINYLEDDGGGGCPYISPWNGTKFKRENNLMVQSEFQSREVTDYYKLDTDLQQKNGNYSMKIEEFENSEDFIDQMKLYTIDHKEGYKVGVTPEGEYVTYKDSDAPIEAYNSTGDDVLNMVKEKNDDKRLEMNEGSEVILDYGDRSMSRWQFNKLILRSSGFSSHTEGSQIGILADKTSLYVSIKADGSEWRNVTVTHPRNNPHDSVIPLEDQLTNVLGKGHDLSDFKVKIRSTKNHSIDYVGLDNSAPTPVHVQEANLMETIKTDSDGKKKYLNRSLTEDDNAVMHLTPGESCTVNFDVPLQIPGFEERDFVVMTKGFYTRYE